MQGTERVNPPPRALSCWLTEIFEWQAEYTSQFFYIISLCLSRMAVLHFLKTIARSKARSTVTRGIIGFNLAWAGVAIIAVGFQCHLPQPWAILSNHCFDQVSEKNFRLQLSLTMRWQAGILECHWNHRCYPRYLDGSATRLPPLLCPNILEQEIHNSECFCCAFTVRQSSLVPDVH